MLSVVSKYKTFLAFIIYPLIFCFLTTTIAVASPISQIKTDTISAEKQTQERDFLEEIRQVAEELAESKEREEEIVSIGEIVEKVRGSEDQRIKAMRKEAIDRTRKVLEVTGKSWVAPSLPAVAGTEHRELSVTGKSLGRTKRHALISQAARDMPSFMKDRAKMVQRLYESIDSEEAKRILLRPDVLPVFLGIKSAYLTYDRDPLIGPLSEKVSEASEEFHDLGLVFSERYVISIDYLFDRFEKEGDFLVKEKIISKDELESFIKSGPTQETMNSIDGLLDQYHGDVPGRTILHGFLMGYPLREIIFAARSEKTWEGFVSEYGLHVVSPGTERINRLLSGWDIGTHFGYLTLSNEPDFEEMMEPSALRVFKTIEGKSLGTDEILVKLKSARRINENAREYGEMTYQEAIEVMKSLPDGLWRVEDKGELLNIFNVILATLDKAEETIFEAGGASLFYIHCTSRLEEVLGRLPQEDREAKRLELLDLVNTYINPVGEISQKAAALIKAVEGSTDRYPSSFDEPDASYDELLPKLISLVKSIHPNEDSRLDPYNIKIKALETIDAIVHSGFISDFREIIKFLLAELKKIDDPRNIRTSLVEAIAGVLISILYKQNNLKYEYGGIDQATNVNWALRRTLGAEGGRGTISLFEAFGSFGDVNKIVKRLSQNFEKATTQKQKEKALKAAVKEIDAYGEFLQNEYEISRVLDLLEFGFDKKLSKDQKLNKALHKISNVKSFREALKDLLDSVTLPDKLSNLGTGLFKVLSSIIQDFTEKALLTDDSKELKTILRNTIQKMEEYQNFLAAKVAREEGLEEEAEGKKRAPPEEEIFRAEAKSMGAAYLMVAIKSEPALAIKENFEIVLEEIHDASPRSAREALEAIPFFIKANPKLATKEVLKNILNRLFLGYWDDEPLKPDSSVYLITPNIFILRSFYAADRKLFNNELFEIVKKSADDSNKDAVDMALPFFASNMFGIDIDFETLRPLELAISEIFALIGKEVFVSEESTKHLESILISLSEQLAVTEDEVERGKIILDTFNKMLELQEFMKLQKARARGTLRAEDEKKEVSEDEIFRETPSLSAEAGAMRPAPRVTGKSLGAAYLIDAIKSEPSLAVEANFKKVLKEIQNPEHKEARKALRAIPFFIKANPKLATKKALRNILMKLFWGYWFYGKPSAVDQPIYLVKPNLYVLRSFYEADRKLFDDELYEIVKKIAHDTQRDIEDVVAAVLPFFISSMFGIDIDFETFKHLERAISQTLEILGNEVFVSEESTRHLRSIIISFSEQLAAIEDEAEQEQIVLDTFGKVLELQDFLKAKKERAKGLELGVEGKERTPPEDEIFREAPRAEAKSLGMEDEIIKVIQEALHVKIARPIRTILIAEDDEDIQKIYKRAFEQLARDDITVLYFPHRRAAINYLRDYGDEVDLIFADRAMDDRDEIDERIKERLPLDIDDGTLLVKQARSRLNLNIPVIFISSTIYNQDELDQFGNATQLPKQYLDATTLEHLIQKLIQILPELPEPPSVEELTPAERMQAHIQYLRELFEFLGPLKKSTIKVIKKKALQSTTWYSWLSHGFQNELLSIEISMRRARARKERGQTISSDTLRNLKESYEKMERSFVIVDRLTRPYRPEYLAMLTETGSEASPIPHPKLPLYFSKAVFEDHPNEANNRKIFQATAPIIDSTLKKLGEAVDEYVREAGGAPGVTAASLGGIADIISPEEAAPLRMELEEGLIDDKARLNYPIQQILLHQDIQQKNKEIAWLIKVRADHFPILSQHVDELIRFVNDNPDWMPSNGLELLIFRLFAGHSYSDLNRESLAAFDEALPPVVRLLRNFDIKNLVKRGVTTDREIYPLKVSSYFINDASEIRKLGKTAQDIIKRAEAKSLGEETQIFEDWLKAWGDVYGEKLAINFEPAPLGGLGFFGLKDEAGEKVAGIFYSYLNENLIKIGLQSTADNYRRKRLMTLVHLFLLNYHPKVTAVEFSNLSVPGGKSLINLLKQFGIYEDADTGIQVNDLRVNEIVTNDEKINQIIRKEGEFASRAKSLGEETKIFEDWLEMWSEIYERKLTINFKPPEFEESGFLTLENRLGKMAAEIQYRYSVRDPVAGDLITIIDQSTATDYQRKRIMTLMHLFLLDYYPKVRTVEFDGLSDHGESLAETLKQFGIYYPIGDKFQVVGRRLDEIVAFNENIKQIIAKEGEFVSRGKSLGRGMEFVDPKYLTLSPELRRTKDFNFKLLNELSETEREELIQLIMGFLEVKGKIGRIKAMRRLSKFKAPRSFEVVAFKNNEAVGYTNAYFTDQIFIPREVYITDIYVKEGEAYRRHRIGTNLFNITKEHARNIGAQELIVSGIRQKSEAQDFWKKIAEQNPDTNIQYYGPLKKISRIGLDLTRNLPSIPDAEGLPAFEKIGAYVNFVMKLVSAIGKIDQKLTLYFEASPKPLPEAWVDWAGHTVKEDLSSVATWHDGFDTLYSAAARKKEFKEDPRILNYVDKYIDSFKSYFAPIKRLARGHPSDYTAGLTKKGDETEPVDRTQLARYFARDLFINHPDAESNWQFFQAAVSSVDETLVKLKSAIKELEEEVGARSLGEEGVLFPSKDFSKYGISETDSRFNAMMRPQQIAFFMLMKRMLNLPPRSMGIYEASFSDISSLLLATNLDNVIMVHSTSFHDPSKRPDFWRDKKDGFLSNKKIFGFLPTEFLKQYGVYEDVEHPLMWELSAIGATNIRVKKYLNYKNAYVINFYWAYHNEAPRPRKIIFFENTNTAEESKNRDLLYKFYGYYKDKVKVAFYRNSEAIATSFPLTEAKAHFQKLREIFPGNTLFVSNFDFASYYDGYKNNNLFMGPTPRENLTSVRGFLKEFDVQYGLDPERDPEELYISTPRLIVGQSLGEEEIVQRVMSNIGESEEPFYGMLPASLLEELAESEGKDVLKQQMEYLIGNKANHIVILWDTDIPRFERNEWLDKLGLGALGSKKNFITTPLKAKIDEKALQDQIKETLKILLSRGVETRAIGLLKPFDEQFKVDAHSLKSKSPQALLLLHYLVQIDGDLAQDLLRIFSIDPKTGDYLAELSNHLERLFQEARAAEAVRKAA